MSQQVYKNDIYVPFYIEKSVLQKKLYILFNNTRSILFSSVPPFFSLTLLLSPFLLLTLRSSFIPFGRGKQSPKKQGKIEGVGGRVRKGHKGKPRLGGKDGGYGRWEEAQGMEERGGRLRDGRKIGEGWFKGWRKGKKVLFFLSLRCCAIQDNLSSLVLSTKRA